MVPRLSRAARKQSTVRLEACALKICMCTMHCGECSNIQLMAGWGSRECRGSPRGTNCVTMHRWGGWVTAPSCKAEGRRGVCHEGTAAAQGSCRGMGQLPLLLLWLPPSKAESGAAAAGALRGHQAHAAACQRRFSGQRAELTNCTMCGWRRRFMIEISCRNSPSICGGTYSGGQHTILTCRARNAAVQQGTPRKTDAGEQQQQQQT